MGNPRAEQQRWEAVVGPSPLHLLHYSGPVFSGSIEDEGEKILNELSHLVLGSNKKGSAEIFPHSVLAGWWNMDATSQPKTPSAIEEEAMIMHLRYTVNLICSKVFKKISRVTEED